MSKQIEAMKLALEALGRLDGWIALRHGLGLTPQEKEVVTALREALAEQPAQQDPLVTKNKSGITLHVGWDDLPVGTKLYTSPQAQRTWVGLTFGEICECESEYANVFARNIEAKLKEKNT